MEIPGLGHLCTNRVWLSEVRVEGEEVFGGTVYWPGDQEGVCWPKPESLARGARGQLLYFAEILEEVMALTPDTFLQDSY